MIQAILDDLTLPETDQYACWEENLSVTAEMISGRKTIEVRGSVWKASWAYGCLDGATTRRLLAILRSKRPIQGAVLPDSGTEMISSTFIVESITNPVFLLEDNGEAVWNGLGFTLREEEPHD